MSRAAALASYFSANPSVNLLVVEVGHGYGCAKFDSICKLTRTRIERGEAVRRLVVATRSGREAEVYVASRTFGTLVGSARPARIEYGADAHGYPARLDALPVRWTRFDGVEVFERLDLDSIDGEVLIEVVDHDGEIRRFVRGSRAGSKWGGTRSTKALLSGFRRSKNYRMIRVSVSRPGTGTVAVLLPAA